MEQWKDIEGFEGKYQASNLGNVKSLNFNRTGIEKIMKSGENNFGYFYIKLGQKNRYFIHRLIAQTFIPNLNNKPCVNHINGIKTDNRVENLEWCTHSENIKHSFDKLKHKKNFGKDNPMFNKKGRLHHNAKKVGQYDLQGNFIREWYSIIDIQKDLGISKSKICNCCKFKLKNAGGFIFKYL